MRLVLAFVFCSGLGAQQANQLNVLKIRPMNGISRYSSLWRHSDGIREDNYAPKQCVAQLTLKRRISQKKSPGETGLFPTKANSLAS